MAMTTLRRRMLEDLPLRGLATKTQQCDVAAVQQLAPHDRRAPDQISEEELRQYCLFLLNEKKVAESTFRIHLYGIKFLYEITLQRPWPVLTLVRPRKTEKLPVVLSPQEVRHLLTMVEHPKARMCLQLIYACGLRLTEGTQLQVSGIDAQRMLVRVNQGKGSKDRFVPLAPRVLT
jgi:integrase/recombinase XerD